MRRLLGRTGWVSISTSSAPPLWRRACRSQEHQPKRPSSCRREKRSRTSRPSPVRYPKKKLIELYDPKIGKNFDIKNFWMRADLRAPRNAQQRLLLAAVRR